MLLSFDNLNIQKSLKHSNTRCGKTEHSCTMQRLRAVSHRQQDRTKLYFASSCPWMNKYKSQFKLAKRKRCERGQFSTRAWCSVPTGRTQRDASQSAWSPNLHSSCFCIDKYIQNHVKIPWRVSSKKLLAMSWKRNWMCIIIFNELSLKMTVLITSCCRCP